MSNEEKSRVSGDIPRQSNSPVLPTVNPAAEKAQQPGFSLHPVFYVMSVTPYFNSRQDD